MIADLTTATNTSRSSQPSDIEFVRFLRLFIILLIGFPWLIFKAKNCSNHKDGDQACSDPFGLIAFHVRDGHRTNQDRVDAL